MTNFHLLNTKDEIVYSNISKECLACSNSCVSDSEIIDECKIDGQRRRRGILKNINKGSVYLCTSEVEAVNGIGAKKKFLERLEIYLNLINDLSGIRLSILEEYNKSTKRILHNLTSINAHCIQEIYAMVPQETLTKNIHDPISIIQDLILKSPKEAARVFLKIAKNNASMKNEFSVFKKLNEADPVLNFQLHAIHKVVLNSLHIFFQDFTDMNVSIMVDNFLGKVFIDYESVFVALYHIIENTTKYILKGSIMKIRFSYINHYVVVRINMISLRIEDDEVDKIFEEGFSGRNAKYLKKAGQGIGLSLVRKLLDLNKAEIKITRPGTNECYNNGLMYEDNVFELVFAAV